MESSFMSSEDSKDSKKSNENRTMHAKSNDIEIMVGNKTN